MDCFIGSGTTAAVAQRLGRRWIGCDINKGAIQTTSRRLQTVIQEQIEETQKPLQASLADVSEEEKAAEPAQLSFAVYRVNDYDLTVHHEEAVNLACEHIGVTRAKMDRYFDGTLGGKKLVKVIPFNHPLTLLDLEELKRELEARREEDRGIVLVCLGKEPAADAWVEDWNRLRRGASAINRIEVIELRTDLAHQLPQVMGIESELREALTNLFFNAVDAMPQGGTLTLRTRTMIWGERAGATPTHCVIEVIDTGIGMDEDTRRRCLEPFFTTKGERGTGLGLAMVYGVMERHSADIEIDSEPGKGTAVRLVFTVPRTTIGESKLPTISAADMPSLNLLAVDDDPMLARSLRDALVSEGHRVTTAETGQEGINLFRDACERGAPYDAVITDLGMPHVDGRAVARAVKQASPATPVIMLTGWGMRMSENGDVPAHVDRILGKPPKIRELREALHAVTRGKGSAG